ncbi:MAG TPA: bifunctional riboflavin kinase/FAD synthetase [Gemmataceae bacterium]|nr:bifunctional riboflavin kinase/FAD synthetase [Gemmataceae bacterium]
MSVHHLDWKQDAPPVSRGGALTIGNFDGVHRGHIALLTELRQQAGRVGGPAVAMTFDPHPLQLLRPEQFQPLLTTPADRAELLQAHGADQVVVFQTTPELLQLSAVDFFEHVIGGRMQARALIEGSNFGFGHEREGTIETLRTLAEAAGVGLTVVPPFTTADGVPISSSRVRRVLLRGAIAEAAELLGHRYRLRGVVGKGQRRGAGLGFPTANLEQMTTLVPGDGVYAVRALYQGRAWPAAANVGPNPTFGEQARKVEVHLIGFQGDLYGQALAVDFVDRLRDTRPFGSVAELVAQLQADIARATQIASADQGGG